MGAVIPYSLTKIIEQDKSLLYEISMLDRRRKTQLINDSYKIHTQRELSAHIDNITSTNINISYDSNSYNEYWFAFCLKWLIGFYIFIRNSI